ncbi:octaprenyl-diphosphate synthase [Andreprevotia lacus DSM 23236]|jgi:octaprenyl-diphosphate synthase|uniref:Octaprenyl diphosphate synthase n=1 Tax=Andreprevotia lacus DSM 23236 TaxID=1121001 RepID=A0A1W1XZR2_9NEIS|nr:octaprenyl diphosphate synthase [Andreprevotia lacus]SMC28978.1 octaprenyl-diphosphate synthase [Andreprevotia lacus DSM 23236]
MSLEFVKSVVGAEMQAVDAIIRTQLYSDVVLIRQVAEHIVGGGGKRLRPMLVLLAAQAMGYQGENHRKLAAVIEFIHTSTLLHDDVVDESALRRGNPTANALFGNAASVLVGDFMYTRAFQLMVSCDSMRVMQVLADATNIIAEGEVLQLMNIGNVDIDEAGYVQVIQYKTAKLFEAAARLGAILVDAPAEAEDKLARYGMHLGTAFQIIDDVLDYSGKQDDIGKSLGDDLAEGKPTLPLIYAMRNGTEAQASVVREALQNGQREALPAVLAAVQACGALDYAHGVAQQEAAAARALLDTLPDSPARQSLLILAELAVQRDR